MCVEIKGRLRKILCRLPPHPPPTIYLCIPLPRGSLTHTQNLIPPTPPPPLITASYIIIFYFFSSNFNPPLFEVSFSDISYISFKPCLIPLELLGSDSFNYTLQPKTGVYTVYKVLGLSTKIFSKLTDFYFFSKLMLIK